MEGYVLNTYGDERYLRNAVASSLTIRRYDSKRPIALYADEAQINRLHRAGLDDLFSLVEVLPEAHRSIVGFKHHIYRFHPFDRCLFVDSDMIWCKNPGPLWRMLSGYTFTVTGAEKADFFFGGPKNLAVIADYLMNRRLRTMKRFDVTYLPRVQAGMMYSSDVETCREVCVEAQQFLAQRRVTHFRSRLNEGRNEESCEWSLALAMSRLQLPVFPWHQGQNTPQMDYIEDFIRYDQDFCQVSCKYFVDPTVNRLRELPHRFPRDFGIWLSTRLPGRGDYMWVTPFALHFGWLRYKGVLESFATRLWEKAISERPGAKGVVEASIASEQHVQG